MSKSKIMSSPTKALEYIKKVETGEVSIGGEYFQALSVVSMRDLNCDPHLKIHPILTGRVTRAISFAYYSAISHFGHTQGLKVASQGLRINRDISYLISSSTDDKVQQYVDEVNTVAVIFPFRDYFPLSVIQTRAILEGNFGELVALALEFPCAPSTDPGEISAFLEEVAHAHVLSIIVYLTQQKDELRTLVSQLQDPEAIHWIRREINVNEKIRFFKELNQVIKRVVSDPTVHLIRKDFESAVLNAEILLKHSNTSQN